MRELRTDDGRRRVEQVRTRIEAACARAGRSPKDVDIVAVAKTFGPEAVVEAVAAGLRLIGESKVQEAKQKIPLCPGGLEWHMVGHLQRNKVRDAVELFSMIHSIDSMRLMEAVNSACEEAGKVMPVLLEVNVSGEASKFGLTPADVPDVLGKCGKLMNVSVVGIMTIAPFAEDPEDVRQYYKRLRELRDEWRGKTGFGLEELSMGMSNDFEMAVEEGATLVRLGTVLFGERAKDIRGQTTEDPATLR